MHAYIQLESQLIQNRRLMSSDSEVQCQSDDCMELFSPRRVAGHVEKRGGLAPLSVDMAPGSGIGAGRDLRLRENRSWVLNEIKKSRPRCLGLSPPCTMFSPWQYVNRSKHITRRQRRKWNKRHKEGKDLFLFALLCAKIQHQAGRKFYLEHPRTSCAWKLKELRKWKREAAGIRFADYDQCRYNLKCPNGCSIKKNQHA